MNHGGGISGGSCVGEDRTAELDSISFVVKEAATAQLKCGSCGLDREEQRRGCVLTAQQASLAALP